MEDKELERMGKLQRLVRENVNTAKEFDEYVDIVNKRYPNLMKHKKFRNAVYAGHGV